MEQQGELQNDGSLSLVAPRSFKRRKTLKLNSRLENLHQNAKSAEVSDIGLTTINFMIAFSLKPRRQSSVNLTFFFTFAPSDLLSSHQFPLFTMKSRS